MGRNNKTLAYILKQYEGGIIHVTDEPVDARALNAFCTWVPDVGRTWLLFSWDAQTRRSVVTINLPDQDVRSNAA